MGLYFPRLCLGKYSSPRSPVTSGSYFAQFPSWAVNICILFHQTSSLSLIPSGLIESRKINRLPYTPGIHKSYFVRFQLTITDNCCLGEKSLIYLLVDFCFSYKFNPRFSIEYLIGPAVLGNNGSIVAQWLKNDTQQDYYDSQCGTLLHSYCTCTYSSTHK